MKHNNHMRLLGFLALTLVITLVPALYAVDAENCLMCHRFRGLARVDKDGDYRITGRVDDVINVSGHRNGTGEVEDVIDEHEHIVETAVVGFPSFCPLCR